MKYKHLAIILGAVITVSSVSGTAVMAENTANEISAESTDPNASGENSADITFDSAQEGHPGEEPPADASAADSEENGLKGTVSKIDENTITVTLANPDENGQTEITAVVTDETIISRGEKMPGSNNGGVLGGDMNGEPPAKPDGDMGGAPGGDMNGEPPAKPDGDMGGAPDGDMGGAPGGDINGEPPAKPDGDMENAPADMPAGDMGGAADSMPGGENALSLDDIKEGDEVTITVDDAGNALTITLAGGNGGQMGGAPDGTPDGGMGGAPDGGMGGPGGQSQGVDSYAAANEYSSDQTASGVTLSSTGTDENAALIDNGASVTFDNVTVTRESEESSGGDSSSFYGVGAAVLATDGNAYITDSTITTNASGGAGAFAYGDGTVYIADTEITTEKGASGGIHAAGGGTLYAWDVTAETSGQSSAAIRSDRGGGPMVVDGGSYTSNGVGSPAIYSTADISVNNADLTANGSEAICIEGLNSIRLYDCDLTGNMSDDAQNDNTWTVILYQSMSGDSEVGNSTFQMDGGTLTSQNGGIFYTTNTESTFILHDVEINETDDCEFFLQCTGNSNQRGWGQSGSNGADCSFTGIAQDMEGDIIWDSISMLDLYLTEGSTLTGAVTDDESYAGEGGSGYCNLYISSDSVWTVTGDSLLTSLSCEGTIQDADGNSVTIVGTDGTVYAEGDSPFTVTTASYSESADLSNASQLDAWENHAVERPEEI